MPTFAQNCNGFCPVGSVTTSVKGKQLAPPGGKQPYEKGIKAATRALHIDRTEAQRAVKIDKLSPEAKQAARDRPSADEIAALRRTAENPLTLPSERVEARRPLVDLGEMPQRRMSSKEKPYALAVAREMLREMGCHSGGTYAKHRLSSKF